MKSWNSFWVLLAGSWAGLGWIKNSGLFSWVLAEWASMTIVLYIPFGGFLDFCTIVKYPFPSSNSLHAHRAWNSGFPSAVERRTNGRRYVAHPSQKFEAVHQIMFWAMCFLCFISAESFVFFVLPKIQVHWSVTRISPELSFARVFWDDMRELLFAYLPHNDMLFMFVSKQNPKLNRTGRRRKSWLVMCANWLTGRWKQVRLVHVGTIRNG